MINRFFEWINPKVEAALPWVWVFVVFVPVWQEYGPTVALLCAAAGVVCFSLALVWIGWRVRQ